MSINGSTGKNAHGSNGESFEDSFRRLQDVVHRLNEGSLTLQDALVSFEEGMRLADRCSTMLDEAELRVKQVSERAMAEGAASLASLVEPSRQPIGDLTLVEVEVERYQASVLVDDPAVPTETKSPTPAPKAQPLSAVIDDLDPLFDEDD
jgi:exodeoxyribonuclease VII small subunit